MLRPKIYLDTTKRKKQTDKTNACTKPYIQKIDNDRREDNLNNVNQPKN